KNEKLPANLYRRTVSLHRLRSTDVAWSSRHESFASSIPVAGIRRCHSPLFIIARLGTKLSVTTCTHHRWVCPCDRSRHPRPPHGTMVVGAPWTTICHRKPSGCRHQYCDGGCRACTARRLHPACSQSRERDQCYAL